MEILRRHLLEGESVSDVCDEYELNPNFFYRWQKRFFERGAAGPHAPFDEAGIGDAAWRRYCDTRKRKGGKQ